METSPPLAAHPLTDQRRSDAATSARSAYLVPFFGNFRKVRIPGTFWYLLRLADYAKQLEERGGAFRPRDYFDRLNRIEGIPIALGRWEMTGLGDEIEALTAEESAGR